MTRGDGRIEIRRVRPDEADLVDRVGGLLREVYGGEGYVRGPYLDVVGDATQRVRDARVLVALSPPGPHLLGTVTFAVAPDPMANISGPGESEFRMLAVAPDARRRGIGRLLVMACVARARAAGSPFLNLSSNRTMTAAHALYESLGFVRSPERDWTPHEDAVALVTYRLDLSAATAGSAVPTEAPEPESAASGDQAVPA